LESQKDMLPPLIITHEEVEMEKITNYWLLDGETGFDLSEKVEKMLKEGWQPYGNPYYVGLRQVQAIVKYHAGKANTGPR